MNRMLFRTPLLLTLGLVLTGCGGNDSPDRQGADAMRDSLAQVADAVAVTDSQAALQPGQRIQGHIDADLGKGIQPFRSLATTVAEDIGRQVDTGLDTEKGRQALEEANRKLEKLGTSVDATDVRELVSGLAGKTFHDAQVRYIAIVNRWQVSLKGKASDGSELDLELSFDGAERSLSSTTLSYRPPRSKMFDFYKSKGDALTVEIERFEENADGSFAIAGHFEAANLPISPMSKNLGDKPWPSIKGRFAYDALPLRTH